MIWVPGMSLEAVEKTVIEEAYKFYRGNKTQTAQSLKISVRTLDSKLEKYDADRREFELEQEKFRRDRENWLERCRGGNKTAEGVSSPETGIRVESTAQVPGEQVVPLPQRAQVQEMLPRKTSEGGQRKGRAGL